VIYKLSATGWKELKRKPFTVEHGKSIELVMRIVHTWTPLALCSTYRTSLRNARAKIVIKSTV
jgi:hypothetical protein